MDGTIVDTEPYWMDAETEMFASFGIEWTHDDARQVVGMGLWESADLFRRRGVDLEPDEIVYGLTDRVRARLVADGLPWRPGARELLQALREASVPTALVTMSVRSMAEDVARAIPFEAFDVIVAGDEVADPKPHPEPYLAAAERLGVDIADCVAIEDSPAGVTSAAASGAVALGVPNIVDLSGTAHDALWATLAGRTPADLAELLASTRTARERTRAAREGEVSA
ncbi:HAD-IA family hydrolase [Agromyces sp. CFH 90414]|uniref:HAD-IA family hydrolase n=2 Tax=Agromyces agglutinans TaxID=2662258 RepID=A0A6I2F3Y7_9MICO|nr:HAD-IA family hydrolase [Agromyces agglutinans]